jgi:predicted Fe-Mo cluster-binding NifX family protein
MKTIAIPVFGNRISPRIDYTESMQLITVENNSIKSRETIKLIAHSSLEKINMLIELHPDVIICDGVSELSYDKLINHDIKVFPWIHGEVDVIIRKYLEGKLKQSNIQDQPGTTTADNRF